MGKSPFQPQVILSFRLRLFFFVKLRSHQGARRPKICFSSPRISDTVSKDDAKGAFVPTSQVDNLATIERQDFQRLLDALVATSQPERSHDAADRTCGLVLSNSASIESRVAVIATRSNFRPIIGMNTRF